MVPSSSTHSPAFSNADANQCAICLERLEAIARSSEEKSRQLNCNHIFHRECIGHWLERFHNCPLCRAHVDVDTPGTPRSEMAVEGILAALDEGQIPRALLEVRQNVQRIRRVRRLDLSENAPTGQTVRKVNTFGGRIFGFP